MHIATRPKILISVGATAGLAVALTSLAQTHRLGVFVECCDRLATLAAVSLAAWLTVTTRALARQNTDLAAQHADLQSQITRFADRSHTAGQEFVRQVGYLNSDRREDDQHRIQVLAAIKRQGESLGELAERVDLLQVDAYATAYMPGVKDRNSGN